MNKNYDHKLVEKDIEAKWRTKKFFMTHDESKKPFSILLPPPNVTGKLHLGHALDSYIPDSIIRFKKLKGYDVMWVPGMDHAGIATQSKVEDVLMQTENKTRHDLGRQAFIARIWDWKEQHAQIFVQQWYKMGLALDYQNLHFTLDQQTNQAVQKVFIELYNKGYLYKDFRAISWDIKLQTALSNIEVNNVPTPQKMYYIKYKIHNSDDSLTIATVRTETLLSDVAVVYNPNDHRYQKYQGMFVEHPLTKKLLPILADRYVDPKFGSGLMKLSAHAEADIEIIRKLNLKIIETIDKNGFINCPQSQFDKMERFEARQAIANYLQENGYITKIEDVISNVAVSDRSKTVIETLLLPQWFVKMDHFAKLVLKNLSSKQSVKFFPVRLKKTIRQWMQNLHDWTISRQLWWGHQIPAWYKNNEIKVQIESPGEGWIQDHDVLDTWFSSGIAPFAFLNWPKKNQILNRFYPTSLLVTGYDIIFFWVARMYFFGLEFMKQIPFKQLLFHGLIRAEDGRKMSKSFNNGVDPMQLIDEYGSDALRWFLITNSAPGMDIRFSKEKIEAAWRINNKLWNIANFIKDLPINSDNTLSNADKWILNKLANLSKNITKLMQKYDFAVVGSLIYKFIFSDLSGWYVEFLKTQNKNQAHKIFKQVLIILHPFLPFITDRLFNQIYNSELLEQSWPRFKQFKEVEYIDEVIKITTQLRKYREENAISKKEILTYHYQSDLNQTAIEMINKLAYAQTKINVDFLISIDGKKLYIKMDEVLKQKNKTDLIKKIDQTKFEIERAEKMLTNTRFIESAPAEKVQLEREKLQKYQSDLQKYEEELKWKY
ncbi:valyl-tRNA synthetase [Mycoplasmopsis mustelae]|uniref:Valine--tRNA ligase n=1 Tax=Mycoplasmopsis mustelae TaxID=171289 RepID=A0A4R7UCN6_9BACT|nr:valine--tRNA ligase [Mycoplasmopsis mustelae]TDV24149.1 valyl-tRNA synthetase [Mycoplasmopsis mustelae]